MERLRKTLIGLLLLYIAAYGMIRKSYAEISAADGMTYVIFPERPIWIYYAFRPLTVIDGALTGMRFDIAPHQ